MSQHIQRLIQILSRRTKTNPVLILFIDEMHSLLGLVKAECSLDAGNLLKPALSRGEGPMLWGDDLERIPSNRKGRCTSSEFSAHTRRRAKRARDSKHSPRSKGEVGGPSWSPDT